MPNPLSAHDGNDSPRANNFSMSPDDRASVLEKPAFRGEAMLSAPAPFKRVWMTSYRLTSLHAAYIDIGTAAAAAAVKQMGHGSKTMNI
jgi:hypothetical protein